MDVGIRVGCSIAVKRIGDEGFGIHRGRVCCHPEQENEKGQLHNCVDN